MSRTLRTLVVSARRHLRGRIEASAEATQLDSEWGLALRVFFPALRVFAIRAPCRLLQRARSE